MLNRAVVQKNFIFLFLDFCWTGQSLGNTFDFWDWAVARKYFWIFWTGQSPGKFWHYPVKQARGPEYFEVLKTMQSPGKNFGSSKQGSDPESFGIIWWKQGSCPEWFLIPESRTLPIMTVSREYRWDGVSSGTWFELWVYVLQQGVRGVWGHPGTWGHSTFVCAPKYSSSTIPTFHLTTFSHLHPTDQSWDTDANPTLHQIHHISTLYRNNHHANQFHYFTNLPFHQNQYISPLHQIQHIMTSHQNDYNANQFNHFTKTNIFHHYNEFNTFWHFIKNVIITPKPTHFTITQNLARLNVSPKPTQHKPVTIWYGYSSSLSLKHDNTLPKNSEGNP